MPYKWVEPDVFVTSTDGSACVYRAYKQDQWSMPMTYWFTTSYCEEYGYEFDIRALPEYETGSSEHSWKPLLRKCLDEGRLVSPPDEE